jgi:anti-sigma regulatory factor (Ser/Thr protein kinase)
MVATADALLRDQDPDLVATLIIARYDPSTGWVRLAAGGHPPALLLTPSGATVQLSAPGCPIGWPGAGSEVVVEAQLAPGDSLVLYTDGLVEARRDILEGLDALVAHATEVASRPASELVHELVDRALAGAERSDDSLALVVRRSPVAVRPVERHWTFDVAPSVARSARVELGAWLASIDVEAAVVDDALLVASELVTNSAKAGSTSISVAAVVTDSALVLDVTDDGQGSPLLDELGFELPDDDADKGRGLLIVRAIVDDVSVLSTAQGTAIRTEVRLPSAVPSGG